MNVDVMDMTGKKVGTTELPAEIFEAPVRTDLMHQAFVRQMANARLGTHKTKTRSEVRGGGRKPWRQKGTGRARQGSIRSAQWVGGGKIHTPRPRDYAKDMPRKMRRAALRSALSAKAADMVLVEGMAIETPKTKTMAEALLALAGEVTVLLLLPESGGAFANVARSAGNIRTTKVLNANYLNVRDLLGHDKIVLPVETLDVIQGYLGRETVK
ncbi:MAG TPA: 50S ribosomal protein L4 [Anaerolineales bacterium]|nr:50S ribosomal protein L4 [Anaerolineales bacterium]